MLPAPVRQLLAVVTILAVPSVALAALAPGESVNQEPTSKNVVVTFVGNSGGSTTAIFEPATKIDPTVDSHFELGDSHRVVYLYRIANAGDQQLKQLTFPVSDVLARRSVHASPDDQDSSDADLLDRLQACDEALLTPDAWRIVCTDDNSTSTLVGLRLGWSYRRVSPVDRGLPAGQSVEGFGFQSADLPGVVSAQLRGSSDGWLGPDPYPGETDEYHLSTGLEQELLGLLRFNHVDRYVAAPAIHVPNPFDCRSVLIGLRTHLYGWVPQGLLDKELYDEVDPLLLDASQNCQLITDTISIMRLKQVRLELRKAYPDLVASQFVGVIVAPEQRDKWLAVRVLDFNVAYVLDFLLGLAGESIVTVGAEGALLGSGQRKGGALEPQEILLLTAFALFAFHRRRLVTL